MNRQMWIIFITMASLHVANSQIIDDFSEKNGPFSEFWEGDIEKYRVNDLGELQLNDQGGGSASLYQKTSWSDKMSWEFYFKLDFSPSNNNRLEIFLWTDSMALGDGNGYLLSIGENGNMDAIQLLQMVDGDRIEIASSSMGLVATDPVVIRMKGVINEGIFTLEIDDLGGVCFLPEIEVTIDTPTIGSEIYFGWSSQYTSTRVDRFFFDDIYVGSLRLDANPPSVSEVKASRQSLDILFSEPMDISTLVPTNYDLSPVIDDLQLNVQKQKISITTNVGFDNGIIYGLTLSGLKDLSENSLDTLLEFEVPRVAAEGDLLINEILFNPRGDGADFVEIYNTTNDLISLNDVTLLNNTNNDVTTLNSIGLLEKNAYLVLTDNKRNILQSYPSNDSSVIFEIDLPRFNNDDGNVSLLFNESTIDDFDYNEDFHQQLIDDVDGISLERIALDRKTNEPSNWTSALASFQYGTPGLKNSVSGELFTSDNIIELEQKVFTPEGIGMNQLARINFKLNKAGFVGTLMVYNDSGHLIRTLAKNEILSSSATKTWDGADNHGNIAPMGIYIIHVSLFHLDGDVFSKKLTVGLGRQLN